MKNNSKKYYPNCDDEIVSSDINITEGVALCSGCGELNQLSDLNFSGSTADETLSQPSKDIFIESDGNKVEVSISLFSITQFLVSLAITLFWNGIVSVFLSLAVAAIYFNLFGPVPDWFPVPGLNKQRCQEPLNKQRCQEPLNCHSNQILLNGRPKQSSQQTKLIYK